MKIVIIGEPMKPMRLLIEQLEERGHRVKFIDSTKNLKIITPFIADKIVVNREKSGHSIVYAVRRLCGNASIVTIDHVSQSLIASNIEQICR